MSPLFHNPRRSLAQVFPFLICLLGAVSSSWSMPLPDALGISWGTPLAQFRQMAISIEEEWLVWDQAIAVRTGTIQNQLPNTGSLILVFHEEHGLIKIHWASLPIQRDATGSKGIAAFNEVKAQLMSTYGPLSQSKEETDVQLHGFYGDFYECLQDMTCGQWEAIWETSDGEAVILELIALDSETGFLHLTQQGPNLQQILKPLHGRVLKRQKEI